MPLEEEAEEMQLTSNEEYALFNQELGLCIGAWANVEHALAGLAASCVSDADYINLSEGFFGIENFRSKRKFVDRMVLSITAHQPDLQSTWVKLEQQIGSASEVRNQLVHRTLGIYEKAPVGRRYALIPFPDDFREIARAVATQKWDELPPPGAMCVHQLAEAENRFLALNFTISNFRDLLCNSPKFFPESYEQQVRAPSLRDLDTRFRAALGLPPRPSSRSQRAHGDAAAEIERQKMQEEKGG
jgi:hypothetical protein